MKLTTLASTIAIVALAASAHPVAALSSPNLPPSLDEGCIGCQILPSTEQLVSIPIGSPPNQCTIALAMEISGFDESCGDDGVDCDVATCEFMWKLRYRTSGACTGLAFDLTSNGNPAGTYPPSATVVTLNSGTFGPKKCNTFFETYDYDWYFEGGNNPILELEGTLGCGGCEPF